jgi:hypothetical protein
MFAQVPFASNLGLSFKESLGGLSLISLPGKKSANSAAGSGVGVLVRLPSGLGGADALFSSDFVWFLSGITSGDGLCSSGGEHAVTHNKPDRANANFFMRPM